MIYERVKTIADMRGMSLASLEREAKIGNGTIGKWKDAEPGARNLFRVAKVLGVDINILLEGTDKT